MLENDKNAVDDLKLFTTSWRDYLIHFANYAVKFVVIFSNTTSRSRGKMIIIL